MKKNLLTAILASAALFGQAQGYISTENLVKHISILSADSLMGRATGSIYEAKAANYIIKEFKKSGIEPKGNNNTYLQEFDFQVSSHGVKGRSGKANNVVGFLNNNAPYTIVIGGHYDHLGTGEDGNSLDGHADGKIHNGADDNASGTAGVIELANYFATNKIKEKFNFLFICFSGEELGLFGSNYFCEHPTIDLSTITCMINMDMIGRLVKDTPVLTISGTGTCAEFVPALSTFRSAAMDIKLDSAGVGPSDHTSFYNKQIPALHFFTGTHLDYHKPSDDADKINFQGTEVVLNIIAGLVEKLPSDKKLGFLKTRNPSMGGTPAFKVTLGIMPSYGNSEDGMKVEAVLDGKPAMKAGMKDGDIILSIGSNQVKEIQTYMEALSKFKKGDKTTIKVRRGAETLELPLEF
jgi:acetylornithine deacetylase/succinyl-diaminopimelate desuccinylase-like protein